MQKEGVRSGESLRRLFGRFKSTLETVGEGLVENCFEQAVAFGLRGRKLLFQPVAQCDQFINLGDDTVLLSKERKGNQESVDYCPPKPGFLRLKEKLTDSVVRLQTNDQLLNETFWNHYHKDRDARRKGVGST